MEGVEERRGRVAAPAADVRELGLSQARQLVSSSN